MTTKKILLVIFIFTTFVSINAFKLDTSSNLPTKGTSSEVIIRSESQIGKFSIFGGSGKRISLVYDGATRTGTIIRYERDDDEFFLVIELDTFKPIIKELQKL